MAKLVIYGLEFNSHILQENNLTIQEVIDELFDHESIIKQNIDKPVFTIKINNEYTFENKQFKSLNKHGNNLRS